MIFGLDATVFWFITAAVLFIAEILSGTVALLCLCIGCVSAGLCALTGLSITVQLSACAVLSLIVFFASGSAIKRFYAGRRADKPEHLSNMDALIHRQGKVTATITANYSDGGRVKIDGDSWQAYTTAENAPIEPGKIIVVAGYDGIVLKVLDKDTGC